MFKKWIITNKLACDELLMSVFITVSSIMCWPDEEDEPSELWDKHGEDLSDCVAPALKFRSGNWLDTV